MRLALFANSKSKFERERVAFAQLGYVVFMHNLYIEVGPAPLLVYRHYGSVLDSIKENLVKRENKDKKQ